MNHYNKSKLISTDENIKFLEQKLFYQSQSIDELTKTFDKLFSAKKNSKFCGRQTNFEDGITQNKGNIFLKFKHFFIFYF